MKQQQLNEPCASSQAHLQGLTFSLFCFCAKHCPRLLQICLVAVFSQKPTEDMYHWVSQMMDIVQKKNKIELHTLPRPTELRVLTENGPVSAQEVVPLIAHGVPGSSLPSETKKVWSKDCEGSNLPCAIAAECVTSTGSCSEPDCDTDTSNKCPSGVPCQAFQPCAVCPLSSSLHVVIVDVVKLCLPYNIDLNQCPDCLKKSCLSVLKENASDQVFENGNACVSQPATEMIRAPDSEIVPTNDLTAQTSSSVEIETVSDNLVECAVNEPKSALEPSSPNLGASQAEPEVTVQEDLMHVSFDESQEQTVTSSLESMRTSGVDSDTSMLEAEVQATVDFDIKPLATCSLSENVLNFQRAPATAPPEGPKQFAVDVSQAILSSSDPPRVGASAVVGKHSLGNESVPCSHESKNDQLCPKLSNNADVCVNVVDSVGDRSSDCVNSKDNGVSHGASRTTSPLAKLLMVTSSSVDDLAYANWENISESSEEVILLTESSRSESISSNDHSSSDSVVLLDEEPITTTQFGLEEDKLHLYLSTTNNSESQDVDTELSDMEEGSLLSDDLDPFDLPDLTLPGNGPPFDHTYVESIQVEHKKTKSVSQLYPGGHPRAQCFDSAHRATAVSVQDCINLLEIEEDSDDCSDYSEVRNVDDSDASQPASAEERSVFDFLLNLKNSSERKDSIHRTGHWLAELDDLETAGTSSAVDCEKCMESGNGTSRGYHLVDPSYPCVQKKEEGGMIPDERIHIKDDKSFGLEILDTSEMAKPSQSINGELADLCKPSGSDVEMKCVFTDADDKSCLYGYSVEASEKEVLLESSDMDDTVPYGYRDPDMQGSNLHTEINCRSGDSLCSVTNSLPDMPRCFGDLNSKQKDRALAIKKGFLQPQYSQDIRNLMLYCTEQNIGSSSVIDTKISHTLVNRYIDETGFGASNSEQYKCQNNNPRCMDDFLEGRVHDRSFPSERISYKNMNKQNSELCHDVQIGDFDTQCSKSGFIEPKVCLTEEELVCELCPSPNSPTDSVKKGHKITSGNSLRSTSSSDRVTSQGFTSDCFEIKINKNSEVVPKLDEVYLPGELLTDPECVMDVQSMCADDFVQNLDLPPATMDQADSSNSDVDSPSYLEFESVDDNIFLLHSYCCSDIDTGSEADEVFDLMKMNCQILKNTIESEEQKQLNNQTSKMDSEKLGNAAKDSVSVEKTDASILSKNKDSELSDTHLCSRKMGVSHSLDSSGTTGDDNVGIPGTDNRILGTNPVSSDVSCPDKDAQETAKLEDANICKGGFIQTKSQEEFAKIVDLYFFDGTTESISEPGMSLDSTPCRERKILKCRLQIDMDIQICLQVNEDTVDYVRQLSGLKKSVPPIPTCSVGRNDYEQQKISILKREPQSQTRPRRSQRNNKCSRQLDILGKRKFSQLVLSECCYLKYDKIMGHWFCQLCGSYSYNRISAQKHLAQCHPRTWRQWLNSQCPVRKNLF